MRYLYPVIAVLAYAFFVAALATGLLAVTAVPVLAFAVGAALVAGGQVTLFVRLVGSLVRLTFGSLAVAFRLLRDLLASVLERDHEPVRVPFAYGREALPEFFRLVDEVAASLKVAPVERVLLTSEGNFGVFSLPRGWWRRRTHLVVGLPFVYALTLDELRAVLAHELAHVRLGHLTSGRLTWHFIRRMAGRLEVMREGDFAALSPVLWTTRASLSVLAAIYHPWHRVQEYDADRLSAKAAGSNHAIAALRRVREAVPAMIFAQEIVTASATAEGIAPTHLGEAAARLAQALPARLRKELSLRQQGDPLDLEGRLHPPTAHRIAALHGLPMRPARHGELAARYLPDLRAVEAHVTRAAFRSDQQEAPRGAAERALARLAAPPPAPEGR